MEFYFINENYLDFLRETEPKIMNGSSSYQSNFKFTIGIILNVNGIDYYAPISSIKSSQLSSSTPLTLNKNYKQTCVPIIVSKHGSNIIAAIIRLDFMFPVLDFEAQKIIFANIEDPKRQVFLQKEYAYVISVKNDILTKANDLYNKAINPNHYLHSKCCNFKMLEVKYQEWIKNKTI